MTKHWLAVVVICISFTLAACSGSEPAGTPAEIQLENLLRQSISDDFIRDREVVVSYVAIPPSTTMDRHWHPGEEFHYYLDGEVEIAIDGEESIIGTPGTVGHVPFGKMHTAITGDVGAKLVVFRIHTEGEPVRYLESGDSAEQ